MNYQPIENYGIIGNMNTTALVGKNGSIDWFCFPHHDSPSVFASILDHQKGGHFRIVPDDGIEVAYKQFYWPQTNVLVTRFLCECGVGEIVDFMPAGKSSREEGYHWLVRQIRVARGKMKFRMECYPAFNYARDRHDTILSNNGVCFQSPDLSLGLTTDVSLKQDERGAWAEFSLDVCQSAFFVLRQTDNTDCEMCLSTSTIEQLFDETVNYWRSWLSKCVYKGRWREMIERSALALKLMTYEPTGAIVAAPTCSLPEAVSGQRNWDYRYSWIRDAAFTLYALLRIGFTEETAQFMSWLEDRIHELEPNGSLQVAYSIDGKHNLEEEILDHLEGYRGSGPVRIGNSAHKQFQLDIYGELMDSIYLFNKHGAPISYDLWQYLQKMLDQVCDRWQNKDQGIWEMRGNEQHFVYSKVMCWVALDRGLRLAEKRSFPAPRARWLQVRDTIYQEVMELGWNQDKQSFVQAYGSDELDASNLIMPLVFFVSPNDPKMLKTIDAINRPPERGGLAASSLVYRYDSASSNDGVGGGEGTFNLCTFWLVEAMTRAGRIDSDRLAQARFMFEDALSYANHLGLYAEETGASGEALGNFPQALTHLSLISAAWNLNKAIEK